MAAISFPHRQYGRKFTSQSEWIAFLKEQTELVAQRAGLPRGILSGVIEQESSWAPAAINVNKKKDGTQSIDAGLTQINSINWPRFGVTSQEQFTSDPIKAIEAGAIILKEAVERRKGNIFHALSDYNAGPGNTNKALSGQGLPDITSKYITTVPFRAAKYGASIPTNQQIAAGQKSLGANFPVEKAIKSAGVKLESSPQQIEQAVNVALGGDTLPYFLKSPDKSNQYVENILAQSTPEELKLQQKVAEDYAIAPQTNVNQEMPELPFSVDSLALPSSNQPSNFAPIAPLAQANDVEEKMTKAFGASKNMAGNQMPSFIDSTIENLMGDDFG